jgi:hypothetical protein
VLQYLEEHTVGLGDNGFVGRFGEAKERVRVFGGDREGYVAGEGGEVFHGHGVGGHNGRDDLRSEADMRVRMDNVRARRKGKKNMSSSWSDCKVVVRCKSWLTCTGSRICGFGTFPISSDSYDT